LAESLSRPWKAVQARNPQDEKPERMKIFGDRRSLENCSESVAGAGRKIIFQSNFKFSKKNCPMTKREHMNDCHVDTYKKYKWTLKW
jgi:hypothetical protein